MSVHVCGSVHKAQHAERKKLKFCGGVWTNIRVAGGNSLQKVNGIPDSERDTFSFFTGYRIVASGIP